MMSGIFFMGCADIPMKVKRFIRRVPSYRIMKTEISVDLDGDGKEDKVRVEDNGDSDDLAKDGTRLIANVNGVDTAIKDYEGYVYSSRITTGDLSGDGKADVLLKRYIFGSNYGATEIYILHLEDSGWVEYPYNFIHNPNIDLEQPDKFGDVEYWWDIESYIGATLFEKRRKNDGSFLSHYNMKSMTKTR